MGLRIQTNVQALDSQRNLAISTQEHASAMEKLSSGYRINKAADDAAGLAISEKLKADIRALNMAKRNANDGISLVETAEGAMGEIGNILARLKELSVQGASDTIGNKERMFIDEEYQALIKEINRITWSTEFNGTMLLVGDPGKIDESLSGNSNSYPLEIQVGKNWIPQVDSPDASEPFTDNPVDIIRLDLQNVDTSAKGLGLFDGGQNSEDSAGTYIEGGTPEDSKHRAQKSIQHIDDAIIQVAGYRAQLGAIQSRLNSTVSNITVSSENYSAANSRIRDTDYALETSKYTKAGIVQQAGTAVLAQANNTPAIALKLLGA